MKRGFTVVEMLVVLTVIVVLASISWPRYVARIASAKEVALRENLRIVRDGIDRFREDVGRYPESLQELVDRRYLRSLPHDPLAVEPDKWVIVPPQSNEPGAVKDVRSSAPGRGKDGRSFSEL